ncbi:MAG: hypothetical protein PUC18_12490 [Prevotellaceae bacterium]|nr:hypothetical protein [Prevotellaceae bacterium]
MKKIDVLAWGVQHIASNHGCDYRTDYDEECPQMTIWDDRVPTVMDVRMMCEDLGMPRKSVHVADLWRVTFIDIGEWAGTDGQDEYEPTGYEMWTRAGAKIGED